MDDQITPLIIANLLNIDKYILEKIHLYTNQYCRYVDPILFTFLLGYNPDDNKWWLTVLVGV